MLLRPLQNRLPARQTCWGGQVSPLDLGTRPLGLRCCNPLMVIRFRALISVAQEVRVDEGE